jgi:hypothetical protein
LGAPLDDCRGLRGRDWRARSGGGLVTFAVPGCCVERGDKQVSCDVGVVELSKLVQLVELV